MFKILYGWDSKDTFLHSLEYWQIINLHTVLLLGQDANLTLKEARRQAITSFDTTHKKTKFLLEQALNSPDPKM